MLAVRKTLGVLVSLLALAGILVTGVLATRRIDQRPRTDDAYLQADLVHLAPDVSGRIVELDVRDNQAVRKGDVLFRIDPEPYRMRMDQARAAVQGLEAKLALTADQVAAQTSKAGAAERGIGSAEAQRALASSTLARMQPLLGSASSPRSRSTRRARRSAPRRSRCSRRNCRRTRRARPSPTPSPPRRSWKGAGDARLGRARPQQDGRARTLRWPDHRARDRRRGVRRDRPPAVHDHRHRALVYDRQFPRDRPRGNGAGQRATVYVMAQPSRPLRGEVDSLGWVWRRMSAPRLAACRMSSAPSTGCGSRHASRCASCSTRRPTT